MKQGMILTNEKVIEKQVWNKGYETRYETSMKWYEKGAKKDMKRVWRRCEKGMTYV